MDFLTFKHLAHEAYEMIPPEFREGIDGLDVSRETVSHPTIPDVFTMGECRTEEYPSEFGGAGEVRSIVALYYGSFLALSRLDDDFDWRDEIFETVTHEVRHHLESLALDDSLEQLDYAEDQNFIRRQRSMTNRELDEERSSRGIRKHPEPVAPEYAEDQNSARREGESFDPFFFRSGQRLAEGAFEVDRDVFIEREVDPRRFGGPEPLRVSGPGGELSVPWPERLGDVHFVRVGGAGREPGELFVVLVRARGAWESLRALFRRAPLEVLETEADPVGEA
jgi:predicted Zn-dependent protease with MMP-like domain